MSETQPESDAPTGRVEIRYHGPGEGSLPGSIDARPSIVNDGDTFTVPAADVSPFTASDPDGDTWEIVGPVDESRPELPEEVSTAPNMATLAELVPADDTEARAQADSIRTRAELEDFVAAYLRTHPPIPAASNPGTDPDDESNGVSFDE